MCENDKNCASLWYTPCVCIINSYILIVLTHDLTLLSVAGLCVGCCSYIQLYEMRSIIRVFPHRKLDSYKILHIFPVGYHSNWRFVSWQIQVGSISVSLGFCIVYQPPQLHVMYGTHDQSNAKQSAHTEWNNTLNTYRDDKMMPTVRLNYISNHPTTKLAKLHTDQDMIAPTWGKISASVW